MTKYSTAIPATLILSLFSSVVHGQNYNDRNGKLLKTSNDFQCFSDGLHEDPNDCSVFYRCVDWGESSENSIQSRFTSMKFRCAEGTVFDIERSNCVNIDETSRLECRQLADDITFSRIFERQAGDPDYGVVQPSSEYNQPSQQPSYNRPGPEEPSEQTPGDSGYGDGNNNEPSTASTSPPCEADGFFPIPNDCTHFYRCVSSGNGFLKYDFSCGPGTVWDPDNNACNHPWATSRPDCRSGTDGNQSGSETIEISESPETAAQVAEPSSTTTAAPTTNRPTTRPTQTTTSSSYGRPSSTTSSSYGRPTSTTSSSYGRPSSTTSSSYGRPSSTTSSSYGRPSSTTSSSYGRPSSAKPSTTTTKRSTTGASSTTTTTETPDNSSSTTEGSKVNSTNAGNSCTAEGFFPDEKNCTKFYRCVDEGNGKFTKYEFECAEGTVWDVQETTCNYPYAVQVDNCNSSSSESQTATTAGQSSSSTSSSSQTSSRPPTSSTSSSYNRPTSQSTSSTNQQSSSSQTTSSSSQTSSSSSQTTSSSSQTSSSQTTSSQQTSSSSSSTSSQSTSSNQQTTNSQQSSSSTTNASSQNTTANNATSTASSNNSSQTSKNDKCEEEGFFPSSENCNKFYRCVSNEAGGFTKYNFNCGPGTVWDPENNVCNHPWAVKDEKCRSGGQGTTPMGESTTQSGTSSTQNGTSPVSTPTTETSQQTTRTPSTESTSQATTQPAESSSQPSTVSATTTESSSKPTEPSANSNATTTEPTDGSTTPPCNSTETTTEGGSKNSTKPNNNGIKCEKAGYYPNPKDCKKFYRCVDWDGDKGERFSVYHFDCPEGTIFDPSLNICNHEESVYPPRDCTGSGSQTTDSPSTSKPDNSTTTESPNTTDSSNTTDSTTEISSEPTTLQTTTDASNNTTEPITTSPSETTPQVTTPSESTTKKEPETTTNSVTTTPSETTTPTPAATTQPTTTEISTTPSSSETCPELGPDQYALVCPTGFRRHPKYCNLFYQCTVSKSMDTKIVILSCVNGTLYDEKKIQCLPPDETKKCEGSMMADARNLKKTDDSAAPIVVKADKPICPNEGLFSYKDDCRLFYKCKKDDQGKLSGFLYQCPEGFAFWSISKRCEKTEKVPCENSKKSPTSWRSTLVPVESRNIGF